MSEQAQQEPCCDRASADAQQHRLVTVVTPLWNDAGCICGRAPIYQQRPEWKQIEQTARESEASIAAIFGNGNKPEISGHRADRFVPPTRGAYALPDGYGDRIDGSGAGLGADAFPLTSP